MINSNIRSLILLNGLGKLRNKTTLTFTIQIMLSIQKLFLLVICIALTSASFAQTRQELRPKSFRLSAKLFAAPQELSYSFDQVSADELDHRLDNAGHMPRFARSIPSDISMTKSGTWTTLPDGDRVWRVRVSSPGALALIPCYDEFYIPAGAMLHVYTPDREEVLGAYTSDNNPADGRYNTGLIHGDACIIEYYEPAAVAGQGRIHLNELGHAYRMVPARGQSKDARDFGSSESCEVNVACPEGNDWRDQKNAVVRILVKTGSSYGWCSGSLVNNANQDCTPYILSADHCYQDDITGALPSAGDLNQWAFYFQYQSPTCADPASEGTLGSNSVVGCTFVSASLDTGGNTGSDFVLIRMNHTPPISYLPYYAGWSNINVASENGVGIHHPNADIKKISTYVTPLQSVSWGAVVQNTHWQILWSPTISGHGVTEPGSSGSPIFDHAHHIVGTLTGGGSDCTSPSNNDFYGKFAFHWTGNGTTANKRLQNWLDPANTGIQTLDGQYGPCSASVALDAAVTDIQQIGTVCDSSIGLTFTLTNYGNNQLVEDSIYYSIDGGVVQGFFWTGALNTLQSVSVTLPVQIFSPGTHTVTISSAAPDGAVDGNTINDTSSASFVVGGAAGQYSFFLQTGDQGSQISWELTDLYNNVLYSGGPYTDNLSGNVINQSWCLPRACYDFNIYSASGTGLTGINMQGNFNIKDANGTIVAQMQNANFGSSETISICQGTRLGVTNVDAALAAIEIYPNPSTGVYYISNVQNATSLTVTDALGRDVMVTAMRGKANCQVDLSGYTSGVYFFKFSSEQGSAVKKVVLN